LPFVNLHGQEAFEHGYIIRLTLQKQPDVQTTQMYYLAVRPEDMVAVNKLMGKI